VGGPEKGRFLFGGDEEEFQEQCGQGVMGLLQKKILFKTTAVKTSNPT
jgi:hypothetical protein